MFNKKTVRDVDVKDKVVLVRTDYNVPLEFIAAGENAGTLDAVAAGADAGVVDDALAAETAAPQIASDLRIRASLPTLEFLLAHEAAKIIIISHLGRPEGKRDAASSLKVVAARLAELLPGTPVSFVDEVSGPEVEMAAENLPAGGILLLENLRFSPDEEANSADFAREIVDSTGAELFVQDGFAVVHRAHASTVAITEILPSVAGLLLEKEITALGSVIHNPARPLAVIIGGAKVADKAPLIARCGDFADKILVGGKIAADGYAPESAANLADKIYVAEDFDANEAGEKLDIGPVSTMKIVEAIQGAKTVLWNGALGKVEDPAYATASTIVAKTLGENRALTSVICGGDTSGFVEGLQADDPSLEFTLVSTGGGAALEFLLGKDLPGLTALENRDER